MPYLSILLSELILGLNPSGCFLSWCSPSLSMVAPLSHTSSRRLPLAAYPSNPKLQNNITANTHGYHRMKDQMDD